MGVHSVGMSNTHSASPFIALSRTQPDLPPCDTNEEEPSMTEACQYDDEGRPGRGTSAV